MSTETKPQPDTAVISPEKKRVADLEGKIQLLTDLTNRIKNLRNVPALLLRPAHSREADDVLALSRPDALRRDFEQLKELAEKIRSQEVQDALKAASASEKENPIVFRLHKRLQDDAKHQEAPSPESPQAFTSFEPAPLQLLPPWDHSDPPLRLGGLVDYVKSFNRSNKHRLHIWTSTAQKRDRALEQFPIALKFTIPNVVTIFLTLGVGKNQILAVESMTAFGPREKKPPHSQSDFAVYQKLSQQLARVIQSNPQAPLQLVLKLLASYEDLFIKKCPTCERVLSLEGHIPPVARIWTDKQPEADAEFTNWAVRHATCLHNL
ncbi:hypothetical protein K474DRAFT_1703473 [Panus rudis PR-1116 ss-1]|nr:hypothetical protein K474DRAFT_1703473 [Panus rudis PR-1116 ss-1]